MTLYAVTNGCIFADLDLINRQEALDYCRKAREKTPGCGWRVVEYDSEIPEEEFDPKKLKRVEELPEGWTWRTVLGVHSDEHPQSTVWLLEDQGKYLGHYYGRPLHWGAECSMFGPFKWGWYAGEDQHGDAESQDDAESKLLAAVLGGTDEPTDA